jgi:hypothetical protein
VLSACLLLLRTSAMMVEMTSVRHVSTCRQQQQQQQQQQQ